MAPISATAFPFEPQPRIEIRQTLQPYVITLTETRDFTTYTSTITLGTDTLVAAPTTTPTASSPPIATQTVVSTPAKTTTDSNNGVVIGAVLGTFLGLAVLLALVWKTCFDGRSVLWRPSRYDDDSSYGSSSYGSSRSSRRRVRRRGGDLGVRRPERAYVRRERRGSLDSDSVGRSEGGWRDEKRRRRRSSRVVVRNGMVGLSFGGSGGRRKSSRRTDRWVRREEFDGDD
jgi:hypothetical protein